MRGVCPAVTSTCLSEDPFTRVAMNTHPRDRRRNAGVMAIATLVGLAAIVALATPAMAERPNAGTIKVHDNAVATPDEQNEPHVSCDFWIEGFGMEGESGDLVFETMPPPNPPPPGTSVTPTGDSLTWTADENGDFLEGAFQLPDGHYKVTADSIDDKDKSKVFWVDACVPPTTTSEIPFFPSAGALALGAVGAIGGALVLLRRRT